MATEAQLLAACPSAFLPYRGDGGGSLEGLNTPGQRYTERLTWRVLDAEYVAFAGIVEGVLETVGGPFGTMIRRVPLRHPRFTSLLATGYTSTLAKMGVVSEWWKWREVTVTFATPNFALDGNNAFVTISTSATQRSVECPPSMFSVGSVGPTFNPEYIANGTQLTLETHQLPTLALATYAAYQGRVNDAVFAGYPIGTVLYNGPGSTRTNRVGATESWEVRHEFIHSTVAWNYVFNASGVLTLMTYAGGTYRYPLADLNLLFA